jgi:hypothetical protein
MCGGGRAPPDPEQLAHTLAHAPTPEEAASGAWPLLDADVDAAARALLDAPNTLLWTVEFKN